MSIARSPSPTTSSRSARLTEFAAQTKSAHPMGIQIHSTSHYRLPRMLTQGGAIGKIKEVHSWCPKSWETPVRDRSRRTRCRPGSIWGLSGSGLREAALQRGSLLPPRQLAKTLDSSTGTFGDMAATS